MSGVVVDGNVLKALAADLTSLEELNAMVMSSASTVREANFSFNELTASSLAHLSSFVNLDTLILDNNQYSSLDGLPSLPKLKTLWINNNAIEDLDGILGVLAKQCPQLEYLSLLRNPCCPNELTGKQETEYRRYRLYSKFRLPTLKRLDSTPFSEQEAQEAKEKGKFCRTVVAKVEEAPQSNSEPSGSGSNAAASAQPEDEEDLFAKFEKKKGEAKEGAAQSGGGPYFTQQRHFYSGKASEGNRFIKDDVL